MNTPREQNKIKIAITSFTSKQDLSRTLQVYKNEMLISITYNIFNITSI